MEDKIYSVLEKYGIDEPKASAITEDLLFLCAVSQQRELLPEFLYTFEETIRTGVIGNSDVTAEWNEYLKNLGNCG
jgi:hypothetical protein